MIHRIEDGSCWDLSRLGQEEYALFEVHAFVPAEHCVAHFNIGLRGTNFDVAAPWIPKT